MKCVENVIVTLRIQPSNRQLDMELPAFAPIGQLRQQLPEILSQADPARFARVQRIRLRKDGAELEEDGTLAQYGIWDGSFLDVLCQED